MPPIKDLKKEKFVQLFLGEHYGNRWMAYLDAYRPDSDPEDIKNKTYCQIRASLLMKDPFVIIRLHEILDRSSITPEELDAKLLFLIRQMDDHKTSLAAIKEANLLLGRTNGMQQNINIFSFQQYLLTNTNKAAPALSGGEEQVSEVSGILPENQNEESGADSVRTEPGPVSVRKKDSRTSGRREAYTGLCS